MQQTFARVRARPSVARRGAPAESDAGAQAGRQAALWNTPDSACPITGQLSRELAIATANAIE